MLDARFLNNSVINGQNKVDFRKGLTQTCISFILNVSCGNWDFYCLELYF